MDMQQRNFANGQHHKTEKNDSFGHNKVTFITT
jgi:hypothetical protein